MQCVYDVYICSIMNYIYFAHSKHIFNEMRSFLTPLKTFLPPPNVWTQHDTHSKKKVSEVTGRESVNWNDDGEECERLCEPDSAGVCFICVVGINNSLWQAGISSALWSYSGSLQLWSILQLICVFVCVCHSVSAQPALAEFPRGVQWTILEKIH